MRRFEIEHPQVECQVIGSLYESDDLSELGQDMLEIILANGILIDAGWYPEGDPNGCYVISVTRGLDEMAEARRTTDASDAAKIVGEQIDAFSGAALQTAGSRCDRN